MSTHSKPGPSNQRSTDRSASLLTNWRASLPIVAIIVAAAVLWTVTLATDDLPQAGPSSELSVRPVRAGLVTAENIANTLQLPGVTRSNERGALAFLHAGLLAERRVQRGQIVQEGEVLALLHNPGLMPGADAAAAQAREARLNLDQLQRETERLNDLHQRNLVPTEELERITSRRDSAAETLAQAEAGLNEAREQLAEATLRAPYSGIVSELHVEPGQFVAAGQPVLSLTGNNGLEVALHVSAGRASQLAIDTPVTVTHRDQALSTTGQIREVGPAMPGQPSVVIIELPPAASHWGAGQSVTVNLQGNRDSSLSVPLAAVINPGAGRAHLFRIENGRVFSTDVTTGGIHNGRIVVSGSLTEGDIVAIAGHSQLLDDEPVRVLP